jgi:hypothetical protein
VGEFLVGPCCSSFHFCCCAVVCLYVLISVLWCQVTVSGSSLLPVVCLIYLICVCFLIVVVCFVVVVLSVQCYQFLFHFTELHDINNIPLIVAQCQIKVWLLYTRKKKPKEQSSMDNPEKLVTLDTQDDDNKTNHHYKDIIYVVKFGKMGPLFFIYGWL